ncbi:CmpA/NrtA family ABC transporter substrate-binding protein [Thalassotalea profundi]|uniref:Nitrate ABC transporter ATP-binding protein n=1 Tax=Thalassotalea profundi TaxID=2036687 RepID=A0ABQ3IKB3_9GAMM|nr:CmpA/NrtA family ABC transporter substrate-binding protein [Thalassotalea profundi]GHE83343.1 hypothetical protein GCM10011501_09740 [Thalassotalea profundi]
MLNVDLLEKTHITLGYIPLTDSAPLIIAKEQGFFAKHGLNVTLEKQHSWATLRDKLHAGVIDCASLLAPMPIASSLGLGGVKTHVITPMILSQNGNAITLSKHFYQQLQAQNPTHLTLPLGASALLPIIKARRIKGEKVRLATVYPHSCHYYQILTWLENNNINTEAVDIRIIAPSNMIQALAANEVDGFCVGGPWNAKAVRDDVGVTVATSCDIWPNMPEKVLALLASWQHQHPNTTIQLVKALFEACKWLNSIVNRFEAARIMSNKKYLGVELGAIAPSLISSCLVSKDEPPRQVINYNRFYAPDSPLMNKPDIYSGECLFSYMRKFKHIDNDIIKDNFISTVYRQDLFVDALKAK